MENRKKRLIIFGILFFAFIIYNLALDPDFKLIENLPFGSGLLLTLQVLLMSSIGIAIVEIITDLFLDRYFGFMDKIDFSKGFKEYPKVVAILMLAWSIRLAGYAIMFGLIVLAYLGQ